MSYFITILLYFYAFVTTSVAFDFDDTTSTGAKVGKILNIILLPFLWWSAVWCSMHLWGKL